jgi:thiol peroxidase
MAQKRFAAESGLENIQYYSDYKDAGFGKTTGLLIKGPELLTRGVLVLDQKGVIRYMQFVPKVEELPDMEKAFAFANQLGANK